MNLSSKTSQRLAEIVRCGTARLEQARTGTDFFQSPPEEPAGRDIVGWYLRNFGQIINSDCAKFAFLDKGYVPGNPDSVSAFHAPASEIVKQLVAEMLSQLQPDSLVIFMAGGNGAGKSTFCDGARPCLKCSDWIIDATLASYAAARQTMRQITEKGNMATALIHIDRPVEEAWKNGVIKRAAHGAHRTPETVFRMTHHAVPQNVAKFRSEFGTAVQYIHIRNV